MTLRKKLLIGAAVAAVSFALWGCQMGVGGHGHRGHNHHGHHAAPADHYDVQYQAYETMRTVKCPVCGGSGTLQKPYVCHPVPNHQHISP